VSRNGDVPKPIHTFDGGGHGCFRRGAMAPRGLFDGGHTGPSPVLTPLMDVTVVLEKNLTADDRHVLTNLQNLMKLIVEDCLRCNQIKFRQQGPYNYNYNTEHYNRLNKELSFEKQTQ